MGWENQTAWAMGVLQDPHDEGLSGVAWNLTGFLPWIQLPIPVLVTVSPLPLARSVCQGRQWPCVGQRCGGRCQASGAPHYVTFDGLALTFPRACEYLLVREASGQFTVSAQNLPCGASSLTCTQALTVRLQSTVVHMLRGDGDTEGWHGRGHAGWPHSSTGVAGAPGSP